MLDMGFIPDIETICTKLPTNRQTLLFSATMPPPIKKLADRFLNSPKQIEVARPATANINIAQFKVKVGQRDKRDKLRELIKADNVATAIIFANRKTTVRDLAKSLKRDFAVGEIHGDMDQSSRIAELDRFKKGEINILCASDVAARGLDVKGVSHVFNFDTPWHPDDYVHRIGRTGRAGAKGRAFTFVTPEDAEAIENIEKLTGMAIPLWEGSSGAAKPKADEPAEPAAASRPSRSSSRGGRGRGERDERPARSSSSAPSSPAPTVTPTPSSRPARGVEQADDDSGSGWNGPVPDFLKFSAI
jgi:superfamily II DNA/RNA helicase